MNARKIAPLLVVVLAAAAALGYRFLGNRSGNAAGVVRVSGNIELIDVEVGFKIAGLVVARAVDEGEQVQPGQLVAKLDTSDLECDVALRQAELRAAEEGLRELKNGSRPEEIAAALASVAKAKAVLAQLEVRTPIEAAAAEAAVASAGIEKARLKAEFERAASLRANRTISEEEYDRQKAAYDVAVARLTEAEERLKLVTSEPRREEIAQAKAALAQAQAQYDLVQAGPREETIAQAEAKVKQAAAALKLAQTRLDYATVVWTQPWTGIVLSKNIEPGEYVSPGTPVVNVGNMTDVWLRAYIAQTDQARVKVGQEVRVTTDARPGKVYSGRVSFIASEAEFTPKNVQTPKERIKLVYRIKVDIPNPDMELKRGMPADGEIVVGNDAGG